MLVDAFQPEGITRLAVDSIFMMPHLGVLSTVNEQAALEVFDRDCLVYLGTCVAPVGSGRPGTVCTAYEVALSDGVHSGELKVGDLNRFPLGDGAEAELTLRPVRGWDVGAGPGQEIHATVRGGAAGLILDGRGRPISLPKDDGKRMERIGAWNNALGLYPNGA